MTVNGGSKAAFLKLWPLTQQHRLAHKSLSVSALFWHVNERILGFMDVATLLFCLLAQNTLELMVKENAAQMDAQKQKLSKLRAKVASLEQALELKAGELEREKDKEKTTLVSIPASQVELENLQKVLAMRERELGHIKQLARTIVEQRTELEQFFHEALAQVKQEITASRLQYKKEALQAYRWRLREATAGKLKFPPIRTFHESPHSTNSVHADMGAAARW